MTLAGFSLKNALVMGWRSLTLGAFIFAIAFTMVLFSSFSYAVKEKMDNAIVKGLTGHVQFRSDESAEQDMVEFYGTGWNDIETLPASTTAAVARIVETAAPDARLQPRVRRAVSLVHAGKREQSLMIGIDPGSVPISDAFLLTGGRTLGADGAHEILLTQEQAKNLRASVGDTIQVVTRNALGRMSKRDFTVAGIGDFVMLSLFSYKACFADISGARDLIGLGPGEATDLLVFLPGGGTAVTLARSLMADIEASGIPATFMADTRLSSEAAFSDEGKMPDQKAPDKVRISTWQDMGKTFRGVGDAIFISLAMLVVFLMLIVSILIVNLVSLMGIERYREIGTLRAMGFSKGLVIRLFMTEIMSVSTLAAVLGTGAGILLVLLLKKTGVPSPIHALDFVMGKILYPRLTPGGTASIFAVIWCFAFGASLAPALRACSLKPAETLRQE